MAGARSRTSAACGTHWGAGRSGAMDRIWVESLVRRSKISQAGARLGKVAVDGSKAPNALGKSL